MATYSFKKGEPIQLMLEAVSGNPLLVTAIAVKMRKIASGRTTLRGDEPVALALTVGALVPAAGGNLAYWLFTGSSAALAVGLYGVDAALSFGAELEVTETITVELLNSVSV